MFIVRTSNDFRKEYIKNVKSVVREKYTNNTQFKIVERRKKYLKQWINQVRNSE